MLCRMLKTEVHHLFMPPHSYGGKSIPYLTMILLPHILNEKECLLSAAYRFTALFTQPTNNLLILLISFERIFRERHRTA